MYKSYGQHKIGNYSDHRGMPENSVDRLASRMLTDVVASVAA